MSTLVGKPVNRVDGRLKVTGAATYAAEFPVEHLAHGCLVRSKATRGRIQSIQTSRAMTVPGVLSIMTYENAMQLHFPQGNDPGSGKYAEKDLLPLQSNRIFYGGQVIGVVIAESFEAAEHAATLVSVVYEKDEPAFELRSNLERAYKPAQGLGGSEVQMSRGDAEEALKTAAIKVEETYTTPVYHHNAMEPHATIAQWTGEELMVYDATQSVAGSRSLMASMLGLPKEKVRLVSYFIGGGFGSKGFSWPNTVLAAMAAKLVSRPVKLVLSRQQMFTTAGRRTETIQQISLAADDKGKLTALKHDTTSETSFVDEFVEPAGIASALLYSTPNAEISHQIVRLNKGTPCPMRAPGEAPGTFAIEVAMDELAEKLRMDPIALRLINYAETEEQKKKAFSSKFLKECYQQGADAIGWSRRPATPGSLREGRLLVGYGMATATYPANRSASTAKAILFADGHAEIHCATQDIGTGTYTVMTQIAADAFELPVDKVLMKLGDSDFPKGANSGGSQVSASVGAPIRAAALGVIEKLLGMAIDDKGSPLYGRTREQVQWTTGRLQLAADPTRGETFQQLLTRSNLTQIETLATTNVSTRPQQSEPSVPKGSVEEQAKTASKSNAAVQEDEKTNREPYAFHSFGAQFARVLVDPDLGTVKIDKAVAVMDIGTVLNLKLAKNQIMGGMIFGIGMALMENTQYDPHNGQVVTQDLAQYLVPVNADMPDFDVQFIGKPDPYISPIGARGIGEIGITGITAAVVNAIYNATGKRIRDLPATPDKLI